uniref:Uncharacterized protein n=1 Tax=Anguilla anguilla TaxID=7936 RepID=A0A0E9QQ29_ANGAN
MVSPPPCGHNNIFIVEKEQTSQINSSP